MWIIKRFQWYVVLHVRKENQNAMYYNLLVPTGSRSRNNTCLHVLYSRGILTWLGTLFSILSKKISSGFHSLPRMSKCCKGLLVSKSYKRYSKMVRLWDLWIDTIRELEKKSHSRISFQIWKLGATGMWLLHKWIENWPTQDLH